VVIVEFNKSKKCLTITNQVVYVITLEKRILDSNINSSIWSILRHLERLHANVGVVFIEV
jgi:hypothetical protein